MTTETTEQARERVKTCLAHLLANPTVSNTWRNDVETEARALGLLPAIKSHLGCNCPANPYPATYGGDLIEAF